LYAPLHSPYVPYVLPVLFFSIWSSKNTWRYLEINTNYFLKNNVIFVFRVDMDDFPRNVETEFIYIYIYI
jgi:hypothetical protein